MLDQKHVGFDVKELNAEGRIEGIAATWSLDRGGDVIDPKAFDKTVSQIKSSGRMPKMLWQHDPNQVIGKWDKIEVQEKGVLMEGQLILDLPRAKEAHILLSHKAIDGLSIGYRTKDSEMSKGVRHIKELELWETSVVTFPMNPEAGVTGVKTLHSIRDVERILRDAGVPQAFAKLVASHGYDEAKAMLEGDQREADEKTAEAFAALQKQLKQLKGLIDA